MTSTTEYDVIIVGAGPCGLTLANLLGGYGSKALLLESGLDLLDYPRAVGMDDESLRTFQGLGLLDGILPHVTPHQRGGQRTLDGEVLISINPTDEPFGWPRRNGFIQPLVDRALLDGLDRYDNVEVLFGHHVTGFEDAGDDSGVAVQVRGPGDDQLTYRGRYLVGCDGGSSSVRKILGVAFDGTTESTRWLVVDIADDPVGTPSAQSIVNPERPLVSIRLPHGVRRLEFMVHDHETEQDVTQGATLHELLGIMIPEPAEARVIRARVYTHHARVAASFRAGRVLLAGDAAHLMPVWQGQGFNSGIRDATNLGWKLAAATGGQAGDRVLDTYQSERCPHVQAMVELSVRAGKLFNATSRRAAAVRRTAAKAIDAVPAARKYMSQQRFKPLPAYAEGVVVRNGDKTDALVGRQLPQPRVATTDGSTVLLDDALGPWFSILAWGTDPRHYLDDATRELVESLGMRIVVAVPRQQLEWETAHGPTDVTYIGDDGSLHDWFHDRTGTIVVVRPDRFAAAVSSPQRLRGDLSRLAAALDIAGAGST